jgi:hypothetical protein
MGDKVEIAFGLEEGNKHFMSRLSVRIGMAGLDANTYRFAGFAVSPEDIRKSVQYAKDEQKDILAAMEKAWKKFSPGDTPKSWTATEDEEIRIRADMDEEGMWVDVISTLTGKLPLDLSGLLNELQILLVKKGFKELTVKM